MDGEGPDSDKASSAGGVHRGNVTVHDVPLGVAFTLPQNTISAQRSPSDFTATAHEQLVTNEKRLEVEIENLIVTKQEGNNSNEDPACISMERSPIPSFNSKANVTVFQTTPEAQDICSENLMIPAEYKDKVGQMYFCKTCLHHAGSLEDIIRHVDDRSCSGVRTSVAMVTNDCENEDENSEHNYTKSLQIERNKKVAEKDVTNLTCSESNDEIIKLEKFDGIKDVVARMHMCAFCPETFIYSDVEMKMHTQCHSGQPDSRGFECDMCPTIDTHPELFVDWHRLKLHLHFVHKVDFKLRCDHCRTTFAEHISFNKHRVLHREKCKLKFCKFITDCSADMKIHRGCHETAEPKRFRCCFCGYRHFPDVYKWAKVHAHLNSVHPGCIQPLYKCGRCGMGFQNLLAFRGHYKTCQSAGQLCDHCTMLIPPRKMKEHIRENHNQTGDDSPIVTSESASRNILTHTDAIGEPGIVQLHLHGNTDIDEQSFTGKHHVTTSGGSAIPQEFTQVTRTAESLSQKTLNSNEEAEPEEEMHVCSRHNMAFKSREELADHLKETHFRTARRRKMTAFASDYVFEDASEDGEARDSLDPETRSTQASTGNTDKPEEAQLNGRAVRCQHCYKTFSNKNRLMGHCSRAHSSKRMMPVKCDQCGKHWRNRVQLRNHVREVHEGVKRKRPNAPPKPWPRKYHICEECGYTTPNSTRLTNHRLAVHQGILRYTCDHCEYKTAEKCDLTRHMQRHLGIKKFACQYCSYRTNIHWVLVNHCAKQHMVKLPTAGTRNTMGCSMSRKWQVKREKDQQVTKYVQAVLAAAEADANSSAVVTNFSVDSAANTMDGSKIDPQVPQYVQAVFAAADAEPNSNTIIANFPADSIVSLPAPISVGEINEQVGVDAAVTDHSILNLISQLGLDPNVEVQIVVDDGSAMIGGGNVVYIQDSEVGETDHVAGLTLVSVNSAEAETQNETFAGSSI